jgi:hypothetical protein
VRIATAIFAAGIALVLAGCGGDEDGTTTEAKLSPKQEVEQIGNKWAPLFAVAPNPDACAEFDDQHPSREVAAKYMNQPACEQAACERAGGFAIENCTPSSSGFQESFADATVQDVAVKGDRAAAKFSNGEAVVFVLVEQGVPCSGSACPRGSPDRVWLIHKIGGNAGRKLFEAAGLSE